MKTHRVEIHSITLRDKVPNRNRNLFSIRLFQRMLLYSMLLIYLEEFVLLLNSTKLFKAIYKAIEY